MTLTSLFKLVLIVVPIISPIVATSEKITEANLFFLDTLNQTVNGRLNEFNPVNYYASSSSADWNTAVQDCKSILGPAAHLLSIETSTESTAVNLWLQDRGANVGHYWTSGMYDVGNETWRWIGNLEADLNSFTNWGPEQPSSVNARQRIALRFENQLYSVWETRDDSALSRYVCEVTENPDVPDPTDPISCNNTNSLIIVLDSSLSVGSVNFNLGKEFAAKLSESFTSHEPSKLGFIVYSLSVNTIVQLYDTSNGDQISTKIKNAAHSAHIHRLTSEGILHAKIQLETYSAKSPMRMLVITNGLSDHPPTTKIYADAANLVGIQTFAVGISPNADENELLAIAGGHENRVFRAAWGTLSTILSPVSKALCP